MHPVSGSVDAVPSSTVPMLVVCFLEHNRDLNNLLLIESRISFSLASQNHLQELISMRDWNRTIMLFLLPLILWLKSVICMLLFMLALVLVGLMALHQGLIPYSLDSIMSLLSLLYFVLVIVFFLTFQSSVTCPKKNINGTLFCSRKVFVLFTEDGVSKSVIKFRGKNLYVNGRLHCSVGVDGFVISTSLGAMAPALLSLSSLNQNPLLSRSSDFGPSREGSEGSSPSSD